MGEVRHSRQTVSDGIHVPYAFEYANAAARTGASGFGASDVGKLARQTDNNSLWLLTATTPTWLEVNTGMGAVGEVNTASNVGTGGTGVFKQKSGVDLEFKTINAGSNKVTITDDTGNDEIDVDIAEGNLSHQNLGGAGTNDHAAVDSHIASTSNPHSVTAAQAGAAAASHTHVEADITDLDHTDADAIHDNVSGEIAAVTEKATPVSADLLLIEDSAASNAKKRVQVGNLPGGGGSDFGSEYDFAEKTTSQSTTSTSFQRYLRLTTTSLPAGTYRIGWMYVWRYTDSNDEFQARVQVDNTTNLINPGDGTYPRHRTEPTDGGTDQRNVNGGFRHIALGAGVHTIDIDFATDDTSDTAYMYHGQIELWRVS